MTAARAPTLSSFPKGREFLSGESLRVHTIFYNGTDAPLAVPAPDAPSPLRYTLASLEGGPRYVLSLDDFVTVLRREPPHRPGPPETYALAPTARLGRWEDVADLAEEPFAPGRYALTSRCVVGEALTSPEAPVTVLAPRVEAAAAAYCGARGSLASALAHRADGAVVVLARESYRRRPELGVFRRVATLPGDAPLSELQVFVDAADIVGGRWLAWVRDGRVSARRAWGPEVESALDDVAPHWSQVRLAAPGLQRADASGLLVVTGEAEGRGRAAAIGLTPDGAAVLWEADFEDVVEDARLSHGADGRVWLARVAVGGLRALPIDLGGASGGGDRLLLTFEAPCVGWSLPAIVRAGVPVATVLEGPTARNTLRVHTVPLDGGEATAVEFGPMPEGVVRWDVLPQADGALLFAAAAGRLYVTPTVGGDPWRELGRVAAEGGWFRVYAVEGAPWVEWDEPGHGTRRVAVGR